MKQEEYIDDRGHTILRTTFEDAHKFKGLGASTCSSFSHGELAAQLQGRKRELREKLKRPGLPESVVYSCDRQIKWINGLAQHLQTNAKDMPSAGGEPPTTKTTD